MSDTPSILIVEDSASQALLLEQLLLRHFSRVLVAHSGAQALGLMRAERPTLVISDVRMPEMDGYELCRQIKADPALASVPLILITSLIDLADVVKGLECGASGFLSKPYNEEHLLARIQFLLANPQLSVASDSAAGVDVNFGGKSFVIESGREQILSFLLSAYELALGKNKELQSVTEALQVQTRVLERSNQDLEQFASVASHDLQEPLRMVSSYLGLLDQRAQMRLDAKEQGYVQYAVDGARRMQQMVDDLLEFSNVKTGGKSLAQADLGRALENALTNLEVTIGECRGVITYDLMPAALVDITQFTQLLQNLISNALKFCAQQPPVIHLGWERRWGQDWVFSIRDNGIGIAPENFERIFQLFQRVHGDCEYPGSGMGLAICKKIVERHGGRIWVESELGCGTTVFFTLPDLGRVPFGGGNRKYEV